MPQSQRVTYQPHTLSPSAPRSAAPTPFYSPIWDTVNLHAHPSQAIHNNSPHAHRLTFSLTCFGYTPQELQLALQLRHQAVVAATHQQLAAQQRDMQAQLDELAARFDTMHFPVLEAIR